MIRPLLLACGLVLGTVIPARAEDGADLWLRYRPLPRESNVEMYRRAVRGISVAGSSPTVRAARDELLRGLSGLLGRPIAVSGARMRDGLVIAGTPASSPVIKGLALTRDLAAAGPEGYVIRWAKVRDNSALVIAANSDVGVLYGAFALLRHLQTNGSLREIHIVSAPKIRLRMLDHWDNLDRSVERGYAGQSLWEWSKLPGELSPRYVDYARANASIGINGAVLTNVNANARVLTPEYTPKVAALANVFRPYGIRVYLTARFSAPVEIGKLPTADPLDPAVRAWWKSRADEIYAAIPDFGGFLVKANSEGQPGPQQYGRTHADGANALADAVAPHGGVVIWRAFVYSNEVPSDRIKQAYDEFVPLEGKFHSNVIVQVKNGALDFQPREPFHPIFGAMPKTPLALELQITKEYLGQDSHLVFLAPLFEEVLRADTHRAGPGSTVGKVLDGSYNSALPTAIAGVSNIGSDTNWTGSIFNQANWYAYGRLAWDHDLSSSAIADEWIRMTLSNDARVVQPVKHMMLISREAVVNYMTPLGLVHIMATGHHYGPGPWANGGRPDWTPSYYHRADSVGLGFDRTATGSNAVAQYADPVRTRYANRATVPDSVLLFFHHVRWTDTLDTGRTLWSELTYRYNAGVDSVHAMERTWSTLQGQIDPERFAEAQSMLAIQAKEAAWWRDAAVQYFQIFSRLPLPTGYPASAHSLDYYEHVRCPANVRKPRCDAIP